MSVVLVPMNIMSMTPWVLFDYSFLKYFHVFGRKCFVLKDEYLGKFEAKADGGIFIGYYLEFKAYRVYLIDH